MKLHRTLTSLLPVFFVFFLAVNAFGIVLLSISGSWSLIIDVGSLQGPAGSDLKPSYESATNQILATISNVSYRYWHVDVRKVDTLWNTNLNLYVKRTGNGTGSGSISGGTSYILLTSTDQAFFSGYRNRTSIPLQLKIDGVSVQIPPNTYITTIYYTAVDGL
jgi:hypothetical protein